MSVSYNTANKSTWQTGQTTRSCSVNCSGTYRYAVAFAMSFGALPTSVKYDGVDMTLLDSYSGQTSSGFYFGAYGLQNPNTGTKTVTATWGSSQECWLGVSVVNSSSADITVKGTAKNSGHSTYPDMSATLTTATGDMVLSSCSQYDTDEYGEGYAPAVTSGTVQAFSSIVGPSSNGGAIGGYKGGGASSTTTNFGSDASGTLDWVVLAVALTDAGGGGATDLTVQNSSSAHTSENVALTQQHTLAVADTASTHTSENLSLDNNSTLSIDASSTDSASENVVLVQNPTLVVAATSSAHTSEIFALTQDHQLVVADTANTHTSQNVALGGIPPAGDITGFDCAVGTDALAVRNVIYDGSDKTSSGFEVQWRAAVNGGSYGSWTSSGEPNAVNNWPFLIGGSWSPGDIIKVQLRTSNDAGLCSSSAELSFKLHESWHRTGVKPGYTVGTTLGTSKGYAANGWDVVAPQHYEGTLTVQSGSNYNAVFVALDTSYVKPIGPSYPGYHNDVTYDGVDVTKIISHSAITADRRDGSGGFEAYLKTGFSTGAHLMEFDWTTPQSQRSLEFVALVMKQVNQTTPMGGQRLRLWGNLNEAGNDGVDDLGTTYEPILSDDVSVSTNTRFTIPSVSVSYDEFALSVVGFYGSGGAGTGVLGYNSFGEAAPGSNWSAGNNSTPRPGTSPNFNGPFTTGLTMFAGDGNNGQQVAISAADYDDIAPTLPLHDMVWRNLTTYTSYYVSGYAITFRPTPEMISSAAVTLATTEQVNWQCATEVNHGRILSAITLQSDPAPTAAQIRDEIDGTSTTTAYTGAWLATDTKIPTNGEVPAAGGTFTDTITSTQAPGDYRLSLVYETWQGALSQYDNLGTAQAVNFTITDNTLSPSSTSTSHTSANVALTQVHNLTVQNTGIGHTSQTVTVEQFHQLVVQDSLTTHSSPNFALMEVTGTAAGTVEAVRGMAFNPEGFEWRLFDVSGDAWTDYTANLVYTAGGTGAGQLTAVTGSASGLQTYAIGTLESITGDASGVVLESTVGYGIGVLPGIEGSADGFTVESLDLTGTVDGVMELVSASAEGRISWEGWLPAEGPLDPVWTPEDAA